VTGGQHRSPQRRIFRSLLSYATIFVVLFVGAVIGTINLTDASATSKYFPRRVRLVLAVQILEKHLHHHL
jgi:hypothetical protein